MPVTCCQQACPPKSQNFEQLKDQCGIAQLSAHTFSILLPRGACMHDRQMDFDTMFSELEITNCARHKDRAKYY